ncbi:hypothetical protein [Microbulbifer epialgicus]|uniref:Uncharacterized protein n=1 Tax=Microbulbifer epialgicus TaxID=393907 RepID=A0ABV4NT59_9GAMM
MGVDEGRNIINNNLDIKDRLSSWRRDTQSNIETSTQRTLETHAQALSSPTRSLSSHDQLEVEMRKIMQTAVDKADEMKKFNVNQDEIRKAILPAIQDLKSPYPSGSPETAKFEALQKSISDRVDAEIVGVNSIHRRNMRT